MSTLLYSITLSDTRDSVSLALQMYGKEFSATRFVVVSLTASMPDQKSQFLKSDKNAFNVEAVSKCSICGSL